MPDSRSLTVGNVAAIIENCLSLSPENEIATVYVEGVGEFTVDISYLSWFENPSICILWNEKCVELVPDTNNLSFNDDQDTELDYTWTDWLLVFPKLDFATLFLKQS
jgi:hypothetical protein